ncbi:hypothetical protein [uncultured Fibrella sp.]
MYPRYPNTALGIDKQLPFTSVNTLMRIEAAAADRLYLAESSGEA